MDGSSLSRIVVVLKTIPAERILRRLADEDLDAVVLETIPLEMVLRRLVPDEVMNVTLRNNACAGCRPKRWRAALVTKNWLGFATSWNADAANDRRGPPARGPACFDHGDAPGRTGSFFTWRLSK